MKDINAINPYDEYDHFSQLIYPALILGKQEDVDELRKMGNVVISSFLKMPKKEIEQILEKNTKKMVYLQNIIDDLLKKYTLSIKALAFTTLIQKLFHKERLTKEMNEESTVAEAIQLVMDEEQLSPMPHPFAFPDLDPDATLPPSREKEVDTLKTPQRTSDAASVAASVPPAYRSAKSVLSNSSVSVMKSEAAPDFTSSTDLYWLPQRKGVLYPVVYCKFNLKETWKLENCANLFELMTLHHTNSSDLLKALITFDFTNIEEHFKSRNQFYVWLNVILRSEVLYDKKSWLKMFLQDTTTSMKLCWGALRKSMNVHVLSCCRDIGVYLSYDQETEHELHRRESGLFPD